MRKRLSIFLVLCLLPLLLGSCSQLLSDTLKETEGPTAPVYTQGDKTQPTGADTPSDAPTEPAQPEPSGVDAYGFTLWPEGNYLADPKFDTEEFLPDFDIDPSNIQYGSTCRFSVASTKDTIYAYPYFTGADLGETVLLFSDRATGLTMPLCGKPECTHDGANCDAFVGFPVYGMRIYDGKLWWADNTFDSGLVLNRMKLDGTDREMVMKLNTDFLVDLSGNSTWTIHRGYLYVGGQNDTVVSGKAGSSFTIYARSLDAKEEFTVLDRVVVPGRSPELSLKPVGNDLYIRLSYVCPDSEVGDTYHEELYRWSSKTRKAEQLFSVQDDEFLFDRLSHMPVPGDGVYFARTEFESDDNNTISLFKYSFETGEIENVSGFKLQSGTAEGLTRDYLITRNCRRGKDIRVYIYDHQGNLVSQSELLNDYYGAAICLAGEDEEYVYFECVEGPDGRSCILALPIEGGDLLVLR